MLDMILSLIYTNWISIGIIVLAIIYITYLMLTKQWAELRSIAYGLMLQAERLLRTSPGKEKFEAVFDALYAALPKWIRLFVSKKGLKSKLQVWYDLAKDYLDDTELNNAEQK